jgi:hypothetical protein
MDGLGEASCLTGFRIIFSRHFEDADFWGHKLATRRAVGLRPQRRTKVSLVRTNSKFTTPRLEISHFGLSVKFSPEVEMGVGSAASFCQAVYSRLRLSYLD